MMTSPSLSDLGQPPAGGSMVARLAAVMGALLLAACAPDPLPGERHSTVEIERVSVGGSDTAAMPVVALVTVDGRHITLVELERRLAQLSPIAQQLFDTPTTRIEFLEYLLWVELMSNEATRLGWTDSELVDVIVQDLTARDLLRQRASAALDGQQVTDEAVAIEWDAARDTWLPLRRRRVSGLRVPTVQRAQELAAEFATIRATEPPETEALTFATLARIYSTHESRAEQGAFGIVVHPESGGNVNPELAEYLFASPEAALLEPYEAADGVWLFYVTAEAELVTPTLEDVTARIRERLTARMRADEQRTQIDAATASTTIEVDDALVAQLATLRGGETEVRPRRFDAAALANRPEAVLGNDWNSLAQGILHDYRVNDAVAAILPAPPAEPDPVVETP